MSTPAAAASSQNVVLPILPELTNSNFLDILVPAPEAGSLKIDSTPVSTEATNPLMDALKSTANRNLTEKFANAYESTGDPLLDAFFGLRPWYDTEGLDAMMKKAWAADPLNTVKVVWNVRSIHDGKSEKEVFYG